ncbi:hypothetical protein NQU39_26145, partial [Escherichia coli]|uniref:hypothetical protein n=1 Tax=Escherichia coli TaxID=562 RepID=UPI002117FDD3
LYHLAADDVSAAAEEALAARCPDLALLLATAGNCLPRDCLLGQLDHWQTTGADQFVPKSILRLYTLLAGLVSWETSKK